MFTRFEEQWHCGGGGARLGGAMQAFLWPSSPSDFIP